MGIFQTIKQTFTKLQRDGLARTYRALHSSLYDRWFDWKYDLDTETWVSHDELVKENNLAKYTGHYQANNVLLVRDIFKHLKLPKDETFVDLGSGKGRILILAAEYGFKTIKGIELSDSLCTIAKLNLEAYKKKKQIESSITIYNADATTYEFQPTDTILHLYNPFNGIIFEKVIENLKTSIENYPRKMTIIYINPVERRTLESKLKFSKTEDFIWNESYTIYSIEP